MLKKVCEICQINTSEFDINKNVGETGKQISSGQAQRVGIARALYKKPKIIILDEATSALDKETEKKLIKNLFDLKKNGMTIVLVSHDPNLFNFCESYYDLDLNKFVKKD